MMIKEFSDDKIIKDLMLPEQECTPEIRADIINAINLKGEDYVENLAISKKITAFAAHTLMRIFPTEKRWIEIHNVYCERNRRLLDILNKVFMEAQCVGIKTLCVTENFGSLLLSKSCIGCFQSSDIDMTASRGEKESIDHLFLKYGFELKSDTEQVTKYKNNIILAEGFSFQITWVAVARSFLNQQAPTRRLIDSRNKAIQIEGTSIRVLEPTTQLYFAAYHIAAGHYFTFTPGIRLYVDIDTLIRKCNSIDWESLFLWSEEDEVGARIIMVIYLSHKILLTPVPKEVLSYIEDNIHTKKFAERLLDVKDLGFGCSTGKMHRLYIDLASNGISMPKAFFKKIVGR